MIKNLLTIVALFLIHPLLFAQDGTLETSYGQDGIAIAEFFGQDAEIFSIIKADDRIIAGGYTQPNDFHVFSVAAFDMNGSLDTNFGDNGVLLVDIGTGDGQASTLVQQTDGKYLAGGWVRNGSFDQYLVVRLLENGILDSSFGDNGIVTGVFSASSFAEDEIAEMKLLSDGKIVVAGRSYNGLGEDIFVSCFNSDGSLFTDFGTNGSRIISFDEANGSELASALDVDADDNIYIGGRVSLPGSNEKSAFVLKLDNLGNEDMSYGTDGKAFYTFDNPDIDAGLNAISVDAEGKVVAGGGAFNFDFDEFGNQFFFLRFSADGSIDEEFGNDGLVIIESSSNRAIWAVKVREEGDIIGGGSGGLVRLNENGLQDLSFGNNGLASDLFRVKAIVVDEGFVYGAGFEGALGGPEPWKWAVAKFINESTASFVKDAALKLANFAFYPNPVADYLLVTFEQEIDLSGIQLFNEQGQLLKNIDLNANFRGTNQVSIDLNEMATGSLFLRVFGDEGSLWRKVVKQ